MLRSLWAVQYLALLFLRSCASALYLKTNEDLPIQRRDLQNETQNLEPLSFIDGPFEALVGERLKQLQKLIPNPFVLKRVWALPTDGPQKRPQYFTRISIEFFDLTEYVHYITFNGLPDRHSWSTPQRSNDPGWGDLDAWHWSDRRSTLDYQLRQLRFNGSDWKYVAASLDRPHVGVMAKSDQLYWTWEREFAPPDKAKIFWQGDTDHKIYNDNLVSIAEPTFNETGIIPPDGQISELPQTSKRDVLTSNNGTMKAMTGLAADALPLQEIITQQIDSLNRTWPRQIQLSAIRARPINGIASADPSAFTDLILLFYDQRPGYLIFTHYSGSTVRQWSQPTTIPGNWDAAPGNELFNGTETTSTITEQMDWLRRQGVRAKASQVMLVKINGEVMWSWTFTEAEVTGSRFLLPVRILQFDGDHSILSYEPVLANSAGSGTTAPSLNSSALGEVERLLPGWNASLPAGLKIGDE